jgi:hypothetical protein
MYREESKLFIQSSSGMFNPMRTPPKTAKQGKIAVERDVNRALPTLPVFKNQGLKDAAERILATGDTVALQKFLSGINGMEGIQVKSFSPSLHTSARNKRGRVNRRQRNYIVADSKQVAAYRKDKIKAVGTARAGYVPALRSLGGKVPRWIQKPWAKGGYSENWTVGLSFTEISTNSTKIPNYDRAVQSALNARAKTIQRKTRLLIRGKSVKLGFATTLAR